MPLTNRLQESFNHVFSVSVISSSFPLCVHLVIFFQEAGLDPEIGSHSPRQLTNFSPRGGSLCYSNIA